MVIVLATAHAAKFEEAIRRALGDQFWDVELQKSMPPSVKELMKASTRQPLRFAASSGGLDASQAEWTEKLRGLVERSAKL
mmetsp:Transcript_32008/g.71912  ORF Transcript_32008/g.71912 Transcript_32008/m.71912 type:complete len:81 (+) Transcript_32008:41-283(+)